MCLPILYAEFTSLFRLNNTNPFRTVHQLWFITVLGLFVFVLLFFFCCFFFLFCFVLLFIFILCVWWGVGVPFVNDFFFFFVS